MPAKHEYSFGIRNFMSELEEHGNEFEELPSWMFEGLLLYTDLQLADDNSLTRRIPDFRTKLAFNIATFAGARLTNDLEEGITHILVGEDKSTERALTLKISG